MHSRAFENPVFLAQYTQDLLPLVQTGVDGFRRARSCTICHAPVAHRLSRAAVVVPDPELARRSGVTCDFCHTISGHRGSEPGNGNYKTEPGLTKFGPFATRTGWHHQYNALQTRSEFCAICHSVQNEHGLNVKSTYAEWQASRHAKEGIQCQDCHMSLNGFLTEGRAIHDSGVAAIMRLGTGPVREKLYTHRFQGARTQSQIEGAIQIAFEPPLPVGSGDTEMDIVLQVDNSRTGHKLPSGSVELRFLWLDVYAETTAGVRLDLTPVASPSSPGLDRKIYDVTGACPESDGILAGQIPAGRRIYRTLLADSRGHATLAFYDAKSIVFDNRLNASEVRTERYRLRLPKNPEPQLMLLAKLYYVAYPQAFAGRLGLPAATPIEIASAKTRIFPYAKGDSLGSVERQKGISGAIPRVGGLREVN